MNEQNKNTNEEVIEVPVNNGNTEEVVAEDNLLNLEDVAYMVMVGRTKDGETFFRQAGVNDLIIIRGLLEFGLDEVKHEFAKYFFNRDRASVQKEQE